MVTKAQQQEPVSQQVAAQSTGMVREENPFGAQRAQQTALVTAEESKAISEVQAALVIAKRFPRDPIACTDKIINACTRMQLAEKGQYQYSRGGTDILGPSIRLAEVIAQNWGNMVCGVTELSRNDGFSECNAYAWDLETNFRDDRKFVVRHWRDTKGGGYKITDERDIYETIANQGARRKRAAILTVVPREVADTAVRQCQKTLVINIEITPEFLKDVIARFDKYGVSKAMLEKRLQKRIESMTPAQAVGLKSIFNSMEDGMSSPADWFDLSASSDAVKVEAMREDLRKQTKQPAPAAPANKPVPMPNPGKGEHEDFLGGYNKPPADEE